MVTGMTSGTGSAGLTKILLKSECLAGGGLRRTPETYQNTRNLSEHRLNSAGAGSALDRQYGCAGHHIVRNVLKGYSHTYIPMFLGN